MKVFISADIEGVTTSTLWTDIDPSHPGYQAHAKQMTEEVLACIQGAKNAGATEIFVKDAHGRYGANIDPSRMPSGVTLLRGWTGHPYVMVEGIDKTFDAALFVGYHSAAGRPGNPLSHTISGGLVYMKINGIVASEFMIYSYACALEGVPSVFLSGDKMLCDDSVSLHPCLVPCPVKEGIGSLTKNYSPEDTLVRIRELTEKALKQDLSHALVKLPAYYEVELCFKEHARAENVSWFPGVAKKDDNNVLFQAADYFEVLRTLKWVVAAGII